MMIFNKFFNFFFVHFDGYYIIRSDEGQPRPKYIFNKCGTNIYFFTLQRFGPSPSLKFKIMIFLQKIYMLKIKFISVLLDLIVDYLKTVKVTFLHIIT